MASYTALMNIKVDSREASRGLNTLSKNLTSIEKTGKKSSTSLSRLEKSFTKIEKSITSASKPIVKMQKSLDKLAGKQMASYQKLVNRLMRDNATLTRTVDRLNLELSKNKKEITGLNQKLTSLSNKLTKATDKMKGLGDKTKKQEGLFDKLGKVISKNDYLFTQFISTVISFISVNIIGYLIRVTDQFILIQNRVRLVNDDLGSFRTNLKAVKQISLDTRQSLYAIANLFSRVGRNSRELGKDTIALTDTVSTVAKSFQIAGATAEEARNAITQLSQALASGRLQGDELRSILELAPTLANSISKSLKISLGDLRTFAAEGMITTDIIVAAVRKSSKEIDKEFQKIIPTIAQGIQNIQTSFQIIFGENQAIQLANNRLALSFIKLADAFSKLSDHPLITKLGLFLNSIVSIVPQAIAAFTAFIGVLGTLGVVLTGLIGVIKTFGLLIKGFNLLLAGSVAAAIPFIGGFVAITAALVASVGAFKIVDDAIEDNSVNLKTNKEIFEDATKEVKKYKDSVIDAGEALDEQKVKTELVNQQILGYQREISVARRIIQEKRAEVELIGLQLQQNSLYLKQNGYDWKFWAANIGIQVGKAIDSLTSNENEFARFFQLLPFGGFPRPSTDGKTAEQKVKEFFNTIGLPMLSADELKAESDKLIKEIEDLQNRIEDYQKSAKKLRNDEDQKPDEMLLKGYLARLEATKKIARAEADLLVDTLRMKFQQPFNIRIEGVQSNIDEFAINLSKTINEKLRKAFPTSQTIFDPGILRDLLTTQVGAGGTATDLQMLARGSSFEDFRRSPSVKQIEDAITRTLLGDEEVQKRVKKGEEGVVDILNVEIQQEVVKALKSLYVDLVAFEVDLAVEFKNKERSQEKLNESKLLELKNLKLENSLFGDGLELHKNKLLNIGKEYDLKIDQLKADYELEAVGEDMYRTQLALLETEKGIAIQIENQRKAASDLVVIESLRSKAVASSQAARLASATLEASKELTSESKRRKRIQEESSKIDKENFDILMKRRGVSGEELETATKLFNLNQENIKLRNETLEKQKLQNLLEKDQLELQYMRTQLFYEERNLISSRERFDAFLMKDQIQSINEYNSALIRMAQAQGINPDFLRANTEYIESFGIYMLEIPEKIDGIEDKVIENLKEREKILLDILKLEEDINKEKNKGDNELFEAIQDVFPDVRKSGSASNDAFTKISDSIKAFSVNIGEGFDVIEQRKTLSGGPAGDSAVDIAASVGGSGILEMFSGIFDMGGMFEELGLVFSESFSMFGDILGAGFEGMVSGVATLTVILKKILIATINNEKFKEAVENFNEALDKPFDLIGDGLAQVVQGLGALLEPLYYIGDIIGGLLRGIIRGITRVLEPVGKVFESLQPVFIVIGVALQTFVLFFNQIFGFVGDLIDKVAEFIGGPTDDDYKSLVLLKAERDVIQEINESLEGVADVLDSIDDALFDITNSSLNLAAPSLKLETAAEKYQELYNAATQFGADETAINDFTSFAKQFLQQSQDVLKSSSTYQDIYDNVIKDVMSLTDRFVDELSSDVTQSIQKGVFDLKVVGSDLGNAIENIVQKYEEGAISFGTVVDYLGLKLSQIEDDIALRDTAEFGALDIGDEFARFQRMRGAAISSSSLEEDLDRLTGTNGISSAVIDAFDEISNTNDTTNGGRSAGRNLNLGGFQGIREEDLPLSVERENPFDLFSVDIGGIFEDLAQFVIDALTHAFGQIIGTFEELLNIVLEPVKNLTDGSFAKMIEHLFESVFGLVTDGKFVEFLEGFFGSLFGIFSNTDFGDFIETFFGGFFEAIGEITSAKFLEELLSFIPDIAVTVGDFLSNLFAPILDLVGKLNPLHYLFGNSPSGILAPIVALVVDVGDFLSGLFKPISNLVVGVGDWVSATLIEPMSSMGDLDIGDWVENILLKPVRDLSVGLIDYFTAILYPILSIREVDFGDYIGMVLYPLYGLVVDAFDFVQAIFDPIFNMGRLDTGDFLENILKPLTDLSTDFATFIQKLFDTVFDGMGVDPARFIEGLLSPFDGITGTLEDILGILGDPFTNVSGTIDSLLNIIKAPFSNLNGTIDNILGIISKPFQSLSGSVTSLVNIIKSPFENLTGSITSIVDILKEPFKGIEGSGQALLDMITGALNFPDVTYDLLGAVTDALKGLFGVPDDADIKLLYNPFHQFNIGPDYFLKFAKGGQVPSTPVGDGGYIFGPSHSQGGVPGVIPSSHGDIPIEMEGGEYIINKKATRNIGLAALNELNSISGNTNIPSSVLSFGNGGITTGVRGTKHIPDQSAINNLAGENGGGFTKSSFSILKFSGETGGTIRDIIGHHGIDIDLRIPDLIEKGKSNPTHFVKYFQGGGSTAFNNLSSEEKRKVEAISTDQYKGTDADTIYKPFTRFGNDVLGRVSLEVGAKDRMTKPVFNGKYEPPPWVPDWVKETIESIGESIFDAISDPTGFIENIAEQVGAVITQITEAIGTAVSEIFKSIGLGDVANFFNFQGGGGPGNSPFGVYDAFAKAIEEFWYPDDAQAVTMISSLLNLDMLQSDISEIQTNVSKLLVEWTDFSMGFGDARSNSSSYLEYLFKDYIYSGLSTPDAAGGVREFLDVLTNQIIGGTATRKAFQHEQRVFDPFSYDMNTPVPRIQYGKMANPFLGQNQNTRPSGRQGYLWDALSLYGRYDSKNESITPNFGFIDGTGVVNFMGGMDNVNKTGIFAQLFGRSSAEGYDGKDIFDNYFGGSAADLAAMGIQGGANYNQLFKENTSGDVRDYDNVFARRMQKLAATLYTFITRQFSSSAVLNLDFNRLNFAPARNNQSTYAQVKGMPSDGMGFYANGGYVSGLSHANGGVLAELEDGEFVIKKSAVDAIGLDTLYHLNAGSMPMFQEGGVVVGRRDYDPLLAQAITEQYRNVSLEGGTYEEVQSIYESLQGTGLNSDLGAGLTEIFGTPEGFFDQINFEGITESGVTNSIIDGISDVFDSEGGGGSSYPVTVVSEPMYLDYMTRPLNAVIVTAGNYMDYISDPLPNRVYQTDYLAVMALPLDGIGDGIEPANFLNRILSPLDDVVINSATLSEALSKVVDRIVIDNETFNYSFTAKLLEMLASDDNSTVEIIDSIDKLYTKVESYFDDLISTQEEVINTQLTKIIELGEELSRITAYYEDIIEEKDEVIKSQSAELIKLQKSLDETRDSLVIALNNITKIEEDLAKTQQELSQTLKELEEERTSQIPPSIPTPPTTPTPTPTPPPYQPTPTPPRTPPSIPTPTPEPPADDDMGFPFNIMSAIAKAISSFFGRGDDDDDQTREQQMISGIVGAPDLFYRNLTQSNLETLEDYFSGEFDSYFDFLRDSSFFDMTGDFGSNIFDMTGSINGLRASLNSVGTEINNGLGEINTFFREGPSLQSDVTPGDIVSAPERLRETLLGSDLRDLANYFAGGEFGSLFDNFKNTGIDIRDYGYDPSHLEEFDYGNAIEENTKALEGYYGALDDFRRNSGFDSRDTNIDFYDSGFDPLGGFNPRRDLKGFGETAEDLIGMITGSGPDTLQGKLQLLDTNIRQGFIDGIRNFDFNSSINDTFLGIDNSFDTELRGLKSSFSNMTTGFGINANYDISDLGNEMTSNLSTNISGIKSTFTNAMNGFVLSGGLESSLFGSGLGIDFSSTLASISNHATSSFNNFELGGSLELSSFSMSLTNLFKGTLSRLATEARNFLNSIKGGGGSDGSGGGGTLSDIITTAGGILGFGRGGFVEFKDGGLAKGPSHQGGMLGLAENGMPFLFEGGEYIINKKSADFLGEEFLNSINSYSGGGYLQARREHDFKVATGKISESTPPPDPLDPEFIGKNISVIQYGSDAWKRQQSNRLKQERENRRKLNEQMALMEKKRESANADMEEIRGKLMIQSQSMLDNLIESQSKIPDTLMNFSQQTIDSQNRTGFIFNDLPSFGDGITSTIDPLVARRDTQGLPPSTFSSGGAQMTNSLGKGISISNSLLSQLISTLENKDLSVTIVDEQGNQRDDSTLQIRRKSQLEYRNASELV